MELNPVVHNNGSLSFEASKELANMIALIKGRVLGIIASLWAIFSGRSLRLFKVSGNAINLPYLLSQIVLLAVAISASYIFLNRIILVVLKISRQVCITTETISITAFTFNLRFWERKTPKTLIFKIDELKIRKTDNPFRFIRLSAKFDNRVFELRDKQKEAYVVFDYFDPVLKEKLTEILVEVTPADLLMPGRLRHR